MRLFKFLVVISGAAAAAQVAGIIPEDEIRVHAQKIETLNRFFTESDERQTMTIGKYDQRLFCLVQFVSRVTGGAEPGSKELMRKRPSEPTSYWRVTKLGATMRVWKRTRGAPTL